MGLRIPLSYRRTAVALVLTLGAVAVPCAAWYLAGSREIERSFQQEKADVFHHAYKKAVKLADGLANRLEKIRENESLRPFFHYQNLYHDPETAAEGVSITRSPLALHGTKNAWIRAHFQIDESGKITLPTLNDMFPDLGLWSEEAEYCSLLAELSEVSAYCTGGAVGTAEAGVHAEESCTSDDWFFAGDDHLLVDLPEGAWDVHLRANELYAEIKAGRKPEVASRGTRGWDGSGDRTVEVGGFRWYTLPVGSQVGLVGIRRLQTPSGPWSQGFLISADAVEQYLDGASFPASFVPFEGDFRDTRPDLAGPDQVTFAVQGTPWGVVLELSGELESLRRQMEADRESFLRIFLISTVAAGIAGLLVVLLVFQSEKLAQQRAQFAASAAHELRTPLAGLRLYGEMLAEGLGDPARSTKYARRVAGEAARLGRVVTNVLSFTHLERESLSVDPVPGNLGEAVRNACERQRPALEESGAVLELDLPAEPVDAVFDRDALAHILQNLLDNAEKYTRDSENRTIVVGLQSATEEVELTVADHGHGVSPKLQRSLFRPFTRGETRDSPAGLGLGLVLVKALAQAQGGGIRYRDSSSGGAAFTVSFPAAPRGA